MTYWTSSGKSALLTATLFISDISSEGHFDAFIRCLNEINTHFIQISRAIHWWKIPVEIMINDGVT